MKEKGLLSMEQVWQDGIKDWEGNIPKRMLDDQEEEKFWMKLISEKSHEQPVDDYAKILAKELLTYIKQTDSVIEIGPGWGNYTFSLADKAESLTCVEPSESCLQFLKKVSERNEQSITFVQRKWEDYDSEEQVDVVVGINCFYRMFRIKEAILNMNRLAKRRAIIGVTTAPMRPHYLDLEREHGYKLKYPKRDYLHLLHLLYEMGIYANCQIVPLSKTYTFRTYDELIEKNTIKLCIKEFDRKLVEKKLLPYIKEHEDYYEYTHSFYAALLDWIPQSR